MAYGDVKEHFSKGELNDLWNFIEFVGEILPSKRDNIEKLKNSFIRYALVKPWPLGNDEEPEFFEIIIDTLKDNQILDMNAKRFIVSFDSERANALLFPKE